jgi:hypothetical protein
MAKTVTSVGSSTANINAAVERRGVRACRGVCEKDTVAEILDGAARVREKARSREADAVALAAGKLSEQQINAKNALKIERKGFGIPPT